MGRFLGTGIARAEMSKLQHQESQSASVQSAAAFGRIGSRRESGIYATVRHVKLAGIRHSTLDSSRNWVCRTQVMGRKNIQVSVSLLLFRSSLVDEISGEGRVQRFEICEKY